MRHTIVFLSLLSLNLMGRSYEEGFFDGYYQNNAFNPKVNPCKLINKNKCHNDKNYKECLMDLQMKKTTCSIYYVAKQLDYLTSN